jgi:hypothetical protein
VRREESEESEESRPCGVRGLGSGKNADERRSARINADWARCQIARDMSSHTKQKKGTSSPRGSLLGASLASKRELCEQEVKAGSENIVGDGIGRWISTRSEFTVFEEAWQ